MSTNTELPEAKRLIKAIQQPMVDRALWIADAVIELHRQHKAVEALASESISNAQMVVKLQAQLAAAQGQSHNTVAGALYDFMGWLTTREEQLVLSSHDLAGPAADAIRDFAKLRNLSLENPAIETWVAAPIPQTAQQAQPAYPAEWATFLHYPQCWDTAAYPTLHDAIHEALAWSGCSVCKQALPERAPSDWDVRGLLASRLKCWHRLTEIEADELVELVKLQSPKPLSEQQIHERYKSIRGDSQPRYIDIYRDAEQAHAIKQGGQHD